MPSVLAQICLLTGGIAVVILQSVWSHDSAAEFDRQPTCKTTELDLDTTDAKAGSGDGHARIDSDEDEPNVAFSSTT